MLTKRIWSLPMNYRKLIFAPKLIPAVNSCQVNSYSDCTRLPANIHYESPKFKYKLEDPKNSSAVLKLLKFNFKNPNLTGADTISSLTKLVQLCKQETLPPERVVHDDFFNSLCALIESQATDLSLSETTQILDLLFKLKVVASRSKTIQILLDRIDALVNTASIGDYNTIMQALIRLARHPTAQAIKTRLVKRFIYTISTDFDKNNVEFLIEAFRFACHDVHDQQILKVIVDALKNNNFESQSPHSILSLMHTLNSLKNYSAEWDDVLLKAQNAFIANIPQIENKDIVRTLRMCASKLNDHKTDQFYNKTLFDTAINKFISTECNLIEGVELLNALQISRHTSKDFLDYFLGQIYCEVEICGNSVNHGSLFTMLTAFANLKYKPLYWEWFMSIFKSDSMLNHSQQTLLYGAYHLACLGCYEPKLLKALFEGDLDFGSKSFMYHIFLKLYQLLKANPDYTGPLPSERQIELFETLIQKKVGYILHTSLVEALGGPEYVKTNIRTKLFHQIDHLIAFGPGGEPIPINDVNKEESTGKNIGSVEYLEDLVMPEHSRVVAVMSAPEHWYARNTKQMLGTYETYYDTLETLSCRVVTICYEEWKSLSESSKTPFLMNLIKNKLENKER